MPTVLSIFGTRPEAIKLAPVLRELKRREASCTTGRCVSKVCVTAQHRQMLDQVLSLFEITPDYDLNLMAANQTPTQVAAATLTGLEPIFHELRPDWVVVQGDTTTAAAAAFGAFMSHIRVAHVEAGLRTRDKWSPFPEEINRRIAGVVTDLHFAPTELAARHLLAEGVPPDTVMVTGNTVIDALLWASERPFDLRTLPLDPSAWQDPRRKMILVTAHRRESFGEPFEQICRGLRNLALAGNGEWQIVYPVHLNPNVQEPVNRILRGTPHVHLLPPVEYLPLVHLMKRAYLVLTDSGGIQEEAPSLGKPVLVMREVTERPEGIDSGTARVVGTSVERIVSEARRLLTDPAAYDAMARAVNPYGDGHAAERIAAALLAMPQVSRE
jgi:UDP-N-acetylglucosamine 2-epimerase (non-hydrolysing)